jgi:hypothetical protein
MGTPPSRVPSEQFTVQMTRASQILQMYTNAGTVTVETPHTVHIVHPGGRRLWHEIRQQRRCQPFDTMPQEKYELTKDWDGNLYCGIKLNWNYNNRTLDILMPGYIIKQLQKYKHAIPAKPQHCPYTSQPGQYGSKAQWPLPLDTSPPLMDAGIKHIQWVIGSILYYARAVDLTVLMALSTISSKQAHGTENMIQKTKQLLDYLATHLDGTVQFHASDMILNIHSNASYLSEANAHIQACRHSFMGWRPNPTQPIKLNGACFTLCAILRFVVASAAEAELGALFLTANKPQYFDSPLKKWATHNPRHLLIATILLRWALQITQ